MSVKHKGRFWRVALVILLVVFATFAITGCAPEEEAEDPVDEPTPDDEPRRGGQIVVPFTSSPTSLDLHMQRDWLSMRAIAPMYDRLIEKDEDDNLVPGLALEWEFSEEDLTFTLQLRQGVEFHDGTPFNAEAVKFNFDRILDEDVGSLYRVGLVDVLGEVEVLGEYEVRFHLLIPDYLFLPSTLAGWASNMVSPTAVRELGEDFANRPVGTGPFVFHEYERDSELVMVRNESYWGHVPFVDRLRMRIIPEQATQIIEAEVGNIDILYGVGADDIDRIADAGFVLDERCSAGAQFISLNLSREPCSELAVRRAISHSIDREMIIDRMLHGRADVTPAGVCEHSPYHDPTVPTRDFDMDLAASILDEAGWILENDGYRYRDGQVLEVEILSADHEDHQRYNQIIQQQLGRLGFKSDIVTLEWGTYLDYWVGADFDVTYHSQGGLSCAVRMTGANLPRDSYWNVHRMHMSEDPEIMELADEVQRLFDELNRSMIMDDRIQLASELQHLIIEQQIYVPLWEQVATYAVHPRVQDYSINEKIFKFHKAWISE